MQEPWIENTCGQCKNWREVDRAAATKMGVPLGAPKFGACWKNPPTPVMVPMPAQPMTFSTPARPASMQLQNMFPMLPFEHPACGCFAPIFKPEENSKPN